MTELYARIVIGTAATVLAAILFLLRTKVWGRRQVVALVRQWVATSPLNSGLVLALLSAIAVTCFAIMPAMERNGSGRAFALSGSATAPPAQDITLSSDESSSDAQALDALRAYADKIDDRR